MKRINEFRFILDENKRKRVKPFPQTFSVGENRSDVFKRSLFKLIDFLSSELSSVLVPNRIISSESKSFFISTTPKI